MKLIYKDQKAVTKLIRFYEKQHKEKDYSFFDADDFLVIIDFYETALNNKIALNCSKIALDHYPNHPNIVLKNIRLALSNFEYEDAQKLIESNEYLLNTSAEFWMLYAESCMDEDDPEGAIDCLNKALIYNKGEQEEVYFNLARAYTTMENSDHAVRYFKKALAIKPDCLDYIIEFADYCKSYLKPELAVDYYEMLITKDAHSFKIWNNYALLLNFLGLHEKALRAVDISIALKDDIADTYSILGQINVETEDYSEAIDAFKKALHYGQTGISVLLQLGLCNIQLNLYREAESYLRQAAKITPNDPQIWYAMGLNNTSQGLYNLAINCFLKSVEIDEYDDICFYELAYAYSCIDNFHEAEMYFKRAIKINPFNHDAIIDYSVLLHENNKTSEAIKTALDAMPMLEDKEQLEYLLAGLYFESNKVEQAKIHLREALTLNPIDSSFVFELFPSLHFNKHFLKIIDSYDIIKGDFNS